MVKLEWVNATYIRNMSIEKLTDITRPFLVDVYPQYKILEQTAEGKEKISKIMKALQERLKLVNEVADLSAFFFSDIFPYNQEAVAKHLKNADTKAILTNLKAALEKVEPFTKENIETAFRALATEMGIKAGQVIHPARVALTGRSDSPPMFDTVEIIGKEQSIKRICKILS